MWPKLQQCRALGTRNERCSVFVLAPQSHSTMETEQVGYYLSFMPRGAMVI